MKSLMLLFTALFYSVFLTAQTQGPLNGGTFGTAALAGSNQSWINAGNIANSDDVYATFPNLLGLPPSYTNYLTATNFGFSIPAVAIITGIIVEVERSDPSFKTADFRIRIVKGGTVGATERSTGAPYPLTDAYQSYGGINDLWGETWSPADINSGNFGVAIAAFRTGPGGTTDGRVDHIRITVVYVTILPLKLMNFSLTKNDKFLRLDWTTAEETNMSHFEIERSANGRDFISLATIAARNQLNPNSYSFLDNQPLQNISYYRLKMVGTGGDIKYSKILSVHFNSGSSISLFPVPWQKGRPLYITNPNRESLTVQFFNVSGKAIATITTNSDVLPTHALSNLRGWIVYRVFNEKQQFLGNGEFMVK